MADVKYGPMAEAYWEPRLTEKQKLIFNDRHRTLLVSGPRYSAKTWGVLQRLVRHAWETPDARVGVFVKTLKSGKIGVWDMLWKHIVTEWADNCAGFEITTPLKTDGATRMEYFKIRNWHGGESVFQLHSLKVEDEVSEKMKGTVFSCLFFSELTNFSDPDVYRLSVGSLRMPHLKYEEHLWISDTNPSDEEGSNHWVYKLFYDERNRDDFSGMEPDEIEDLKQWQMSVGVIECKVADNTYLDPRIFSNLRATFRNDPDAYSAYVEGKWVETSKDSLFDGVFAVARHVSGSGIGKSMDDWDVPVPDDKTSLLYTGWDLGDNNHAITLCEKVLDTNGRPHFRFLDEICIIGEQVSIEDVTEMAMVMIADWEEVMGKIYQWIHWSDASAFDRYRAGANTWDHLIVNKASRGKICLQPAPKFKQSVRMRCQLVRQLMVENRLNVSVRCEMLVGALKGGVKRSSKASEYVKQNRFKHVFDSATYLLMGELFHELGEPDNPYAERKPPETVSIR